MHHIEHGIQKDKVESGLKTIREEVIVKHSQCKGYKNIFKELDVLVTTVANVINTFKIHGTIGKLEENWSKIDRKN